MPAGARKLTPESSRSGKARTAPGDRNRLVPGRRIGNGFRLERPLSKRGTVWLAEGPDGQPVALKTGPDGLIELEHRTVSSLAHPNILAVRDFIVTDAGRFIVCEYLGGGDLVSLAGLEPRHWLRQVSDLTAVLAYLHGRGIVHRDLKARNVMLDASDRVRLIDFGSAAGIGSEWLRGGTTVVAPMRGGERVTPGDDLYALASLLHELLHGAPHGVPARRCPAPAASALAALVAERVAVPVDAADPDLSQFAAVIKSMLEEPGDWQ